MTIELDSDWRERISQPKFKIKAEKRIPVPMRDGIRLSVDVFRPDSDGQFPALVAMSPYWNEGQYLTVPPGNPHPHSGWGNYAIECGDTNYLVERGYVHVVANVRGTGESEGQFQLMGEVEARDGYDLIEWIARQAWCNGNIGMVGVSYFSWIQYLVAALNPPHLKAIFPVEGAGDFYRDVCYRGGMLSLGFLAYWSTEITDNNNIIQSEKEFSETELKERIERLKADADIRNLYSVYHLLCAPKKNPLLFDVLLHPTDGPWYQERSGYAHFNKIRVPTYCGAALDFADLHLPGGFSAWEGINVKEKKFLIYPQFHERPFHENHDIIVRWYDHWLKGIDTGIMDEPPIKLWVRGRNQWRYEKEWPLARTSWTKLYLRENGLLNQDPPTADEPVDSFPNIPYVTADHAATPVPHVRYSTSTLKDDLEVTGPIALYLYASLDNTEGHWIAEIHDADPDGNRTLLTRGWLKASFRENDLSKSKPYRPWHPYSRRIPVVPNQIEQYAIQIHDNSNVFLVGHRLELDIKSVDHSIEGGWNTIFYHLPNSQKVTHKIHHTPKHPSHLLLPIIPH